MRLATLILLTLGCSTPIAHAQTEASRQSSTDSASIRAIATEAYIYGFPLVDNYRVLHSYFVAADGPEFKAPWNQVHSEARVFTPEDRTIQTPNSDTPYSQLGTDLRTEPLVLTVPAVDADRYYSLQFIDLYTFNYAYAGSRTTGTAAGRFLLAGPNWTGETPPGIDAVFRSETEIGWVQYRTQLLGPSDLQTVEQIQAGYSAEPLSSFLNTAAPKPAPSIEFRAPLSREEERTSIQFYELLDFLLQFCPPHPSEEALRSRFARIGLTGRGNFSTESLTSTERESFAAGIRDAWDTFAKFKREKLDTGELTAADGFGTREYLNGDYLGRMASAVLGIYGNSKEEALYPAYYVDQNGAPLDGREHRYELRFAPSQLPPVNSFWSLTVYRLPESLLVDNPLDRYLINSSMLPDLQSDPDGGITIYVQSNSPGEDRETNWLPAPSGPFLAIMRLYWPKPQALSGEWQPPTMRRVDPRVVTADNFVRAESDRYMKATAVAMGAFGEFIHNREPTPIDQQTVIRMNRDTLYSAAVFDLDAAPVTITLPDPEGRFLSVQVINQDHYTRLVAYGAGEHILTRESCGTRYALVAIRTLMNPDDPADLAEATRLQDQISAAQSKRGRLDLPNWDTESLDTVRSALLQLASTLPDTRRMFGSRDHVDPVRHLIGSALGWGGNPDEDALYLNVTPQNNDGTTPHSLTLNEVPVDGFWSVSVYNADGYFEPNEADAYSINSLTAKRSGDGSVTIQFGDCTPTTPNCLPISPGWNYMVRLYRPRPEVLQGRWDAPIARPLR